MLEHISGTIKHCENQRIVLNIGPFGLTINVPNSALFTPNENIVLFTHLHWNQEQGPSLYGFKTTLEKTVFTLVLSCSGLGPKIGLHVLADLGAETFLHAIEEENEKILSKVSGIGAKKAEQIIVHLKHKVQKLIKSGVELSTSSPLAQWHTVAEALEALNYSRVEINRALTHIKKIPMESTPSFDHLLRQALTFLSQQP